MSLDLNKFFKFRQDQGEKICWAATIGHYRITIWIGGDTSVPNNDKNIKPDDCVAFRLRVSGHYDNEEDFEKFYLRRVLSDELIFLFGYDLSRFSTPYWTQVGYSGEGINVPIDVVRDMIKKLLLKTMPADAGDGE